MTRFFLVLILTLHTLAIGAERNLRAGLLDPKSVKEKDHTVQPSLQQIGDHLRGNPPDERAVAVQDVSAPDHSNLRYLFLGTSRTYGVMLKDRAAAFPNLISPNNGVNLGVPAGNAGYPSYCISSMLSEYGDDAFDVIVMEFDVSDFDRVLRLAKRLRQRYPNALILVLDMWLLRLWMHLPSGSDMTRWVSDSGHKSFGSGTIEPAVVAQLTESTKVEDWKYYPQHRFNEGHEAQFLNEAGVQFIKAPYPADAHTAITQYHAMFLSDMNHYSATGHEFIASLIQTKITQIGFRKFHDKTVGSYAAVDNCESWFRTGVTMLEHERNLVMTEFNSQSHKFALEARSNDTWFKVRNNQNITVNLMIEYMVTIPDCLYPPTRLTIIPPAGSDIHNDPVIVQCKHGSSTFQVHIANQKLVGSIPPGLSFVRVEALEEIDSSWPFRIVGVILTPANF